MAIAGRFPGDIGILSNPVAGAGGVHRLWNRVRSAIGDTDTVAECRHCGTSVEATVEECPSCDREAIVQYDLEGTT